jgi:NAD(P)-dependent dehydrogenase (short-subunit alcohol dehydrogenase family)
MGTKDYFKGKICLVTGANSGIGYAVSEALLRDGAIVYMVGRNAESMASAEQQLDAYAGRVYTLIADVTKQAEVQKAIQDTVARQGRLDFIFNNAGISNTQPTHAYTLEDWKKMIDTNLWSVIYGVHAALPVMRKQGSGHIVNTSSFAGLVPVPFQTPYDTTKYAVVGMTESMRIEYAPEGIRFSAVCPGFVASNIFKKSIDGTFYADLKMPEGAYPAEDAARDILLGLAENKGIIVVPEDPFGKWWREYLRSPEEYESKLVQLADERRLQYAGMK